VLTLKQEGHAFLQNLGPSMSILLKNSRNNGGGGGWGKGASFFREWSLLQTTTVIKQIHSGNL
jgi:hypothetical protein